MCNKEINAGESQNQPYRADLITRLLQLPKDQEDSLKLTLTVVKSRNNKNIEPITVKYNKDKGVFEKDE